MFKLLSLPKGLLFSLLNLQRLCSLFFQKLDTICQHENSAFETWLRNLIFPGSDKSVLKVLSSFFYLFIEYCKQL